METQVQKINTFLIDRQSRLEDFVERRGTWFNQVPGSPILFSVETIYIPKPDGSRTYRVSTTAYRRIPGRDRMYVGKGAA